MPDDTLPPPGTIYRYTDAQGNTHFVDDVVKIPAAHRDQAKAIQFASDPPPSLVRELADRLPDTHALTQEAHSQIAGYVREHPQLVGLGSFGLILAGVAALVSASARKLFLKYALGLLTMGVASSAYMGWVAQKYGFKRDTLSTPSGPATHRNGARGAVRGDPGTTPALAPSMQFSSPTKILDQVRQTTQQAEHDMQERVKLLDSLDQR